ncbi:torsin-1A [Tetranychus urticae]|uniref:Torsin-1A C-terminal domain-containing protein n=1 Tax=Tetranychus urticae TaxID=32264 RepID=T1JTL1_TETUR|nr:torsin-1A [Tetranychus urticae]
MTWVRLLLFFTFCLSCCTCIEPVSTGVYFGVTAASASIYAATSFMYCVVSECCNQEKSAIIAKNWIKYDAEDKLRNDFKKKLHGQHLVESIVIKAITKHMKDSQPRKALVFSFHGWTGGGKNFVSYLIARNLYHEGLKSKFVHVISATEKFPDPTKSNEYKIQLMKFVKEQLSQCGRQLFIFDEIDKVPGGVIDALAPFLEYSVVSKEQNKAIFIFLSNTGGGEIARVTYSFYYNGMNREDIGLQDIESLIDLHAFNEEGGLKKSSLIHKNLIDFFIPFLPLEKIHVQSCIVDYLQEKYNITRDVNDKFVVKIANQLDYFPQDSKVYSKSGCKKVARKVDQAVD